MKTHKNLYYKIYRWENLILAFKKARKGKTKRDYVIDFQSRLIENLEELQFELMSQTYKPRPLKTFILRDPKTRKISVSDFRDRIIHHALCNIIEPIFQKNFIYDSCANQKGKGTLFAIKRFKKFQRKVTNNLKEEAFCFKADIKHYFEEVDHKILLKIIKKKITDKKVDWLIKEIIYVNQKNKKGMPLGNLTSQFFANIYLNELDYFIKHELKAKYYIRYVDDFLILHNSKNKIRNWRKQIYKFLIEKLELELHPQKSRIIPLSKGVGFVGFRNFYWFRLPQKRNIRKIQKKIVLFKKEKIPREKLFYILQGWNSYAKWADSFNIQRRIVLEICKN